MDIKGKKGTIVGAQRSGMALARLVARLDGTARISEKGPLDQLSSNDEQWLNSHSINAEWGGHTKEFIQASDYVLLSPGVPITSECVTWATSVDIPVLGEIEFSARFCDKPMIAVTGSNGKTTVVNLIQQVIKESGKSSVLCGNVGAPFADCVLDLGEQDYVVLEISSFQLESIQRFKPYIALLLNCTDNHLDRHQDFDEYFRYKCRIFENQEKGDFAVLNESDAKIKEVGKSLKGKVVYFQSENTNPNFSAVSKVAEILNIGEDVCERVFSRFKGVEHRLEFVRSLDGVDYINDSKSTTAESGRWALNSITNPTIMICGGRDKKIDFAPLRDLVQKKVKRLVVLGEAKDKLVKSFSNVVQITEADSLQNAVHVARKNAQDGDCVLLSPMCASFDMFSNFEERGKVFKDIVNSL